MPLRRKNLVPLEVLCAFVQSSWKVLSFRIQCFSSLSSGVLYYLFEGSIFLVPQVHGEGNEPPGVCLSPYDLLFYIQRPPLLLAPLVKMSKKD